MTNFALFTRFEDPPKLKPSIEKLLLWGSEYTHYKTEYIIIISWLWFDFEIIKEKE